MNLQERVGFLESLEIFSRCPSGALRQLAEAAEEARVDAGRVVVRAGERGDAMYLLATGRLEVRIPLAAGGHSVVATLTPPATVGEIQLVAGGERTADVVALEPSLLLQITAGMLEEVSHWDQSLLSGLVRTATRRLHLAQLATALRRLFGDLDDELAEMVGRCSSEIVVEQGAYLFRQGDPGDAWFVLTSGHLEVTIAGPDGVERVVNEVRIGEAVGEIALVVGGRRNASVRATRRATLERFPREIFEEVTDRFPAFGRRVMQVIVEKMLHNDLYTQSRRSQVVVLVHADDHPDTALGARQVADALRREAGAVVLDRASFEARIARRIDHDVSADHPVWGRFALWFDELESGAGLMVLDAGPGAGQWATECLWRADSCVWITRTGGRSPDRPGAFDSLDRARRVFEGSGRSPRWSLVLVHPSTCERPEGTRRWLEARPFARHLHVRLDDCETAARAARLLTGRGFGLALSGGGARGFAHIGVLRALEELSIPVDVIGGTSIGGIMAGQYCVARSINDMIAMNRRAMALRPFQQYTVPMVALNDPAAAERGVGETFGETRIEDLWRPYFAVSADLTTCSMVVHERGLLRRAARATSSLPGVLVPVVDDGHLLVDGGIINNIPGDLVKVRAGGPVLAVNASPEDELRMERSDFPSQWSILWHRLLPWLKRHDVPLLGDILMRTLMTASVERTNRIRESVDVFLDLPVEKFGMLDFEAIEELVALGHAHACERLAAWPLRPGADTARTDAAEPGEAFVA